MRRLKTKKSCLIFLLTLFVIASAVVLYGRQRLLLIVENAETGEVYVRRTVRPGEELSFEWEHSFEHIPWFEYYEIQEDGSFLLHTIAVAGFGAGIPAEMDCEYRYENGLIYMDGIESMFPEFHWIHSQTALKSIRAGGVLLLTGPDLPHHEKMVLRIEKGLWEGLRQKLLGKGEHQ